MRPTVLIAFADTGGEAGAIRAAAEWFGASVFWFPVGRPLDFLDVLGGKTGYPDADMTVLSFHGEDGAFLMPELGEEIYREDEPRGPVGAELIRSRLRLTDTVVLSTACGTGSAETAAAFRERGNYYAAPSEEVEGAAALMFAVRFLYERLAKGASPEEAGRLAASADGETALFAAGGKIC